jgi:CBS domain containing-hemolysin-like protein
VLGKLGHIPRAKEFVEEGGLRFQVEAMDGMRISRLSLSPNGDNPQENGTVA